MAEGEIDSLENLLNQATSPLNNDEDDLDSITRFCDQVNREFDGAHDAVQLLVHKITSPQEKEALLGLTVLEVCVKNCGHKFHAEIGKFRFLNEMIKVISPKYLGNKRSDRVKKKCVELMYCWTKALPHETKIGDAYMMLKKQAIVKEDPTYMDKACDLIPLPRPRPKKAVFEDEDKSKLLARLLKSKHPEDLQAANRLIKNMVKQDAEKNEKVSRRIRELDTVNNNCKLLVEMMDQYDPATSTSSECDVMKELNEALEKHRPTLFRLASDADEKDQAAMNLILEANDAVVKVVERYRAIFGGSPTTDSLGAIRDSRKDTQSLLDLGFDPAPALSSRDLNGTASSSLVESELACLGLNELSSSSGDGRARHNSLSDFNDLFGSNQNTTLSFTAGSQKSFQLPNTAPSLAGHGDLLSDSLTDDFYAPSPSVSQTTVAGVPKKTVASKTTALADLDFLGQSLLQRSLPQEKLPFIPSSELNQKPSLNQMKETRAAGTPLGPTANTGNHALLAANEAQATKPLTLSPSVRPNPSIPGPATPQMLSLADVFVPLDTIKPASVPSVTIYDRNGLKIVIHFGRDGPKPHILVMVVSTMTTNPQPVKNFVFQAAVPKLMRVKLQPPSATELPPHNPILPQTAITQVMLLANPQKEQIRLKFKITYTINDQPFTDVGDYDKFPVQ